MRIPRSQILRSIPDDPVAQDDAVVLAALLRRWRVFALSVLIAVLGAPALAASFPPHLRFRSVSTSRVTVHYHQGLEVLAREAAAVAHEILVAHETRYGNRVGRVQVVLVDVDDDPNGFATPLPYPLVQVRAVAPDGSDEFGNYDGWLRMVLTHELAHIVHLDQARGLVGAGRKVFGRAPFLFPNALTPTWMIEGLATYEETEGTAFGRGRNPDTRMVLRMAALEGEFPGEDRPVLGLDRWPAGLASYFFGEAFLRDLTERVGEGVLPELARVHSGRPLPYLDELTAQKVTQATFQAHWQAWREASRERFAAEAREIEARGLTKTRALTSLGYRQMGPRFSPDGSLLAYTSRRPTRFREIRLMGADGQGDRRLALRNSGTSLGWTPDGRALVYDETEVHRLFTSYSDLRVVDVATRRVRRLTEGQRAREPDVSPDGRTVVFVRQAADHSELALIGLDGQGQRDLTRSAAGVQWSGPHWSPTGEALVASRWAPPGWLDLVRVDAATGEVSELTHDRAKDVEPAFTRDGAHVVFRSDRDGVSNLYALRLADGAILRLTNVLGGAFGPDVSPDGRTVAFAAYSARGYDIHLAPVDLASLAPAPPFVDPYPESRPLPPPVDAPDRPYHPLPHLRPRFWSPYARRTSDEWLFGAVTAGADPLVRHVYGLDAHWGERSRQASAQGFYQYDRFRPTFLLTAGDTREAAVVQAGDAVVRERKVTLRATLPIVRRVRSTQALSLAWRRERETVEGGTADESRLDLGGLELSWTWSTARQYPYSISPVDGYRLRVAYLKEDPIFGSEVSLGKLLADGRAYVRGLGESDALALRLGGGTTFGRPSFRRSFSVGGFPDGSLFDVVGTNHSVLRGYAQDGGARVAEFSGRRFAHANAEYRFALAHPQHGWRTVPLFVRHLHASVFADAAHAWTERFRLEDVRTGAGLALGTDVYLGHGLPLTGTVGVARGFGTGGETRVYFLAGLAF
jgi:hypothetical protein